MKIRRFLSATAIVAQISFAFMTLPYTAGAAAKSHKMRSAHFIVTALEAKGLKVEGLRRKAQVYFVEVFQDGVVAILAVDGYSSEIIGVNIVTMPAGKSPKPKGSAGNHFVDITYVFGYEVSAETYESYTEVTTEEISVTEEYSEVSYEETEEVTYSEVEESTEADLDEGTAEDATGDSEADSNNDDVDAADDDASPDDMGDDSGGEEADADNAGDGSADDSAADDGGADDGADDSGGGDEE